MAKFTTLKDVAALANTTAGTVSYVLNKKEGRYIKEETRQRVLEAAKQLNYVKCTDASSLKGKRRKLIGIIVPQLENQFFTQIILSSDKVFSQYGFNLLIYNSQDNPKKEKEIITQLVQQRVDGIIMAPTYKGSENTKIIRDIGINLIIVDRPLLGVDSYNLIRTNSYNCIVTGTEYLIAKGHSHIAYVGWNSRISDLQNRELAVFETVEKYAIPEENIYIVNGDFSAQAGYELTARILDSSPKSTAILYGFNVQALGGIKCIIDRGLVIPNDISILINGSPEWTYVGKNNFTRIDMDSARLGEKAAKVMVSLIEENKQDKQADNIRYEQDGILFEGDSVSDLYQEK